MSRVDAAAGMDRLPWLSDEPPPPPRRLSTILAWVAAAIVVAAAALWIASGAIRQLPVPTVHHRQPTTTVWLPQVAPLKQPQVPLSGQPQVKPAPAPQVRPAPLRDLTIAAPPAQKAVPETTAPAEKSNRLNAGTDKAVAAPPHAAAPQQVTAPSTLRPWPPSVVAGARGRLVQIGAFGSPHQVKQGWRAMVHSYPALGRLQGIVVEARNSRGLRFYRFQVGTTSQAHSEVLCQRMQAVGFSCAVVGLSWKSRVER